MRRFYKFVIFLFAILIFNQNYAQQINWETEKKIITGSGGSNIRPRVIALDDVHGIILWGNEHSKSIHYALWEGDSLSSVYNLNMHHTKAFITSWASTEIAGRDNYVYIVYKEDPAETGKIYLLRSEDYGKTFTSQITVVNSSAFYCRFPGVAIDKDNQPIVSYMRFDTDWTDPEYVSIRSNDYGNTFNAATEVTDRTKGEACDCCPVSMETDDGDRIVVFYRNNRNNIRNMTAAVSFDNGLTYPLTEELDTADWFLQSCPSSGGDGFFDGEYLHTTWNSGRSGSSKAYYSRLNLTTQQVDLFQFMINSQGRNFQQTYPRMAGNRDTVVIAWAELVNNMDVFLSFFTNGQSEKLLTNIYRTHNDRTGNQASPDLAYKNGNVYLIWQDLNDNSVKFKKGIFNNLTSQDDLHFENEVKVTSMSDGIKFTSEQNIDNWILYNVNGNVIANGNDVFEANINLKQRGVYCLSYSMGMKKVNLKIVY